MKSNELRVGNKVGIYKNHHDTDIINILPNDILAIYQCKQAKKKNPYFAENPIPKKCCNIFFTQIGLYLNIS